MNLNDLHPKYQREVIIQRIKDTKLIHQLAKENPRNPIFTEAANLDDIARSYNVYIEFVEELDADETP